MAPAMLSKQDVQEELSLAYVHAVASRAGFSAEVVRKDRDGIDLHIHARDLVVDDASLTSPVVAVQLKAHMIELEPVGATFPFDVPIHNYNRLCAPRSAIPSILVVFAMPRDESAWVECTEGALVLRRSAYWMNLKGAPPSPNESTKRVHVDRANLFNPETVRALLVRVAREENL